MLYLCHNCNFLSFHHTCKNCGYEKINDNIPLDPKYYPEFQYQSKGFFKDIFVKSKELKKINYKLETVLDKYAKFEKPYFVNYVHISGHINEQEELKESREYSYSVLFKKLLIKLGFHELAEYPEEHALSSLLPLLSEQTLADEELDPQRFSCQNTFSSLEHTSITCPPVDAALLSAYFSYFVRSGFLEPPNTE